MTNDGNAILREVTLAFLFLSRNSSSVRCKVLGPARFCGQTVFITTKIILSCSGGCVAPRRQEHD
jgi:hypothetical protein